MQRRFDRVLWWGLALAQVVIPAAYYVGLRDPEDERFSWRMFSGVRLRECSAFVIDERGAARVQGLHASWLNALERGRPQVIARYLSEYCGSLAPELERRCRGPAGERLPTRTYRYDCATHVLREREGAR